jgi:hypothetical protein
LDVIHKESKNAWQISSQVPWNVPGQTWEQMPPLLRRIAVTEALAHLELLWIEGEVERTMQDGIVLYKQVYC